MGVDYRTAMLTPISVITSDLEMMGLENKWGPQSLANENDNATSEQPGIIRQVVGQ